MSKDPKKNVKEEELPVEEITEEDLPEKEIKDEDTPAEENAEKELPEEDVTGGELPTEEISDEEKKSSADDADEEPSGEEETPKRKPIGAPRVVFAVLVLLLAGGLIVTVYLMPMLQIGGFAMTPTLDYGEYVRVYKTTDLKKGDIIAFNFNGKILIRRVLAQGGETFEIDKNGTVAVNGRVQRESYIKLKALGECDLEMPFTVPDGEYFVLGDDRVGSIDSRNTTVGCVSKDQIIGKVIFRVWPMNKLGRVK